MLSLGIYLYIICIYYFAGILSQIKNCNFLIGVTLLKDVLCIINMLSTTLQSKSATLGKAKDIINGVIKSFEELRCEEEFYKFWKKIELMAEEFNITLQINRLGIINSYNFKIIINILFSYF